MTPPYEVSGISLGEKMIYENVIELRGRVLLQLNVKISYPSLTAWLVMVKLKPCWV